MKRQHLDIIYFVNTKSLENESKNKKLETGKKYETKARYYVLEIVAVACLTNVFQVGSVYIICIFLLDLQSKLSIRQNTVHVSSIYVASLFASFISNNGSNVFFLSCNGSSPHKPHFNALFVNKIGSAS